MLDRQRRRPGRERDDAREDAPASENAILALQRTAGNRAVQRLLYDKKGNQPKLKVPPAYANEEIAWDGTKIPDNPTEAQKRTFISHARNPGFVAAVKKGLWIQTDLYEIEASTRLTPESRGYLADTVNVATGQTANEWRDRLQAQLAAAAESKNQILTVGKTQFNSEGQVTQAIRPVLSPADFLPEESDLPTADTDLATKVIPGDADNAKYITYACVLIALLKDDGGVARARELTKNDSLPTDVIQGAQALHVHYRKRNIEYDQRSSADRLMRGDWKYKLLWAGESKWEDLYKELSLKPGKYIFDIEGHTVMTEVLTEVTKGTPMGDIAKVFKHNSESSNYTLSHWAPKVTAIWKK